MMFTRATRRAVALCVLLALSKSTALICAQGAISGQTFKIDSQVVTSKQLAKLVHKGAKESKTGADNCPGVLPDPVLGVVPTQNPNAPAVTFYPNNFVSNSNALPPQTIGATAVVDETNGASDFFPFNTSMCAGQDQVIFASTWNLISYDRNLVRDNRLNTDLLTFTNSDGDFSLANLGEEIEMRYDKFANRFFFAMDANLFSFNTGVCFGVSDRGSIDEETKWNIVTIYDANLVPDSNGCPGDITSSGTFYDYCRAGVDRHAYYFAFNIFDSNIPGGSFVSSTAFVIQKESLLKGGPVNLTVFRDITGYPGDEDPYRDGSGTLIPVMELDDDSEFGYFITQDPLLWGRLVVYRVINPGSTTPTLSPALPIDVPTTGFIASPSTLAPIFGNGYSYLGIADGIDDRLKMAHVRNGRLFTAHRVLVDQNGVSSVSGDRSACRWYEIKLKGNKKQEKADTLPTLVQAGTLWDPSSENPIHYYQPAIMTNKHGDLSLTGMLSSNTQPISAFFVGRKASDPLGTLRIGPTPADRIFAQGSGTNTQQLASVSLTGPFSSTFGQRTSDRQYTCFDPAGDEVMWAVQEFIENGLLKCKIARLDPVGE